MSEEARAVILIAVVIIGLVAMFGIGYWAGRRDRGEPHQWAPPGDDQMPAMARPSVPRQPGQRESTPSPPTPPARRDIEPPANAFPLDQCGVCYRRLRCDRKVSSCPFIEVKPH